MMDRAHFAVLLVQVFVTVLVIVGLALMVLRFARRPRQPRGVRLPEVTSVIREREVIRQIVKIRCPYCGNLYDETHDNCPHCGGKRKT